MITAAAPQAVRHFRSVLIGLLLADLTLVLLALVLYPKLIHRGGLIGASAAVLIVSSYGFLALYSPIRPGKSERAFWYRGAVMGAIGGFWLGADLLSNYFVYRDGPTNSKITIIVYVGYALLLMATALRGVCLRGRIGDGLIVTMWYVILAQLIWVFTELASYYLFSQTPVGVRFIQTEMEADFARSGGTDFQTFVVEDLFGAVFFHLLLVGLVAGLIFGSIAGLIGKVIFATRKQAS
jgi:hypothetical protein